jgi:hypothetical protein
MIQDLINKLGANQKKIFTHGKNIITLTIWNDCFVVYSEQKEVAKKFDITHLDSFLKYAEKNYNLVETYNYK